MKFADIKIGERFRKDLGDLDELAESIMTDGLLHPIGVTPDNELVFGLRRIAACRDILGWTEIDHRVVNVTSIVAGEYAENDVRKDFTPSERVAIKKAIEEEIRKQGERRGRPPNTLNNIPEYFPELVKTGEETRYAASRLAGFGNENTARQAETVVKDGVPELVGAMDRGAIKISPAAVIATKSPEEQRKIVAMPKRERKAAVRATRSGKEISSLRRRPAAPKNDTVRLAIRDTVEAGEAINRSEWANKLEVSEATIQRAELQELARLEGLDEAAAASAKASKRSRRIDPPMLKLVLPTSEEMGEPPPGSSWEERAAWRDEMGAKVVMHVPRIKELMADEVRVYQAARVISMAARNDMPSAEQLASGIDRMLAHVPNPEANDPVDQKDLAKLARESRHAIVQHLEAAIATLEAYRAIVRRERVPA